MHLLSGGKFLRKNARKPVPGEGGDFYLVNGTLRALTSLTI
jgi:hypothetical protein